MSGDVQPRKRKDKRKKKDELSIEEPRGTAAALGEGDVFMHSPHEHGTGGHWCAKIIFFSLLAVLVTLVGLIILENRGLSELEANSVESRYSGVLEGWIEEAHDDDHHDEHTLELKHHEQDLNHKDLHLSDKEPDSVEDLDNLEDEDDEEDETGNHDGNSEEETEHNDDNEEDDEIDEQDDEDDDDERDNDDEDNEDNDDNEHDEDKIYDSEERKSELNKRKDAIYENQIENDDDDEDDADRDTPDNDDSVEDTEETAKYTYYGRNLAEDFEKYEDNQDSFQQSADSTYNTASVEEQNDDDNSAEDNKSSNNANIFDDDDEHEHDDDDEDEEVEIERIEREITDDVLISAEKELKRESREVNVVDTSKAEDSGEDDDNNFVDANDDEDDEPPVEIITAPSGAAFDEIEEETVFVKPPDTLAEEEEYEKRQEELRREVSETSHMWLKLTVGGALLVATHAVLRRFTAPRDDPAEENEGATLSDHRRTIVAEEPMIQMSQESVQNIPQQEVQEKETVQKPVNIEYSQPQKTMDKVVEFVNDSIKKEESPKEELHELTDDKELYSDEEEDEEDEEQEEEDIVPKQDKPALQSKNEEIEPDEVEDDVELIDEEQDDEELEEEEEEEEISDVDDTELLTRLEAKYGRLPEPERPGRQKDGGNSVDDLWPGEPSEARWRQELNRAEEELRQGAWEACERRLSVAALADSARARWLTARALDIGAEKMRDNRLLSRAITAYLHLLKMNERLTDKKLVEIAQRTIDRIQFREDGGNSVDDLWPGEPSEARWRQELNRAEEELRQGAWEACERRLSVAALADSARARWLTARALDIGAEKMRDNRLLSRAITAYLHLLKMNERLTDKKLVEIAQRTIDRIQFRGTYLNAEPVYRLLIRRFPNEVGYRNNLTISFLMANRADLAEEVLKETIKLWPNDRVALAHHGFVLKNQHHKYEEAVIALQKALEGDTGPANEARFYYHLGDALLLLGRFEEAHEVHKRGAALGHFLSPSQRSLYNVPRLKSQPWWRIEDTPYLNLAKALEKSWRDILKESEAAKELYDSEKEGLKERGEWSQMDLFVQGRELNGRCARAPVTCSLARAASCRRGQVKFSAMAAGTHVRPHVGPTNCRLRMHLGLSNTDNTFIRVDKEIRQWQTGKVFMFDDSFEHEVWHNGTGTRLVLIVDVWHPDLTPAERRQLPAI